MKAYKTSSLFEKKLSKLKGTDLVKVIKKIDDICAKEISHFKNLKYDLKQYKRSHVNDSFVILFFDEKNIVHFVDYAHHDVVDSLSEIGKSLCNNFILYLI